MIAHALNLVSSLQTNVLTASVFQEVGCHFIDKNVHNVKCLGCKCKDNSMCSSGEKCEQCKCIRLGKLCLTDYNIYLESLNFLYNK